MKIVLKGPVARTGVAQLRQHFGDSVEVDEAEDGEAPETLASKLADATVLVTFNLPADLPPAPRLRLVHVPASGIDEIELAVVPSGVPVCNAFEHDIGISEYVLAAMLHFTVDLAGRDARFRAGSWAESPRRGAPGRTELAALTVGTVGYGSIGQAVARRAMAFGMKVMAVTRTPRTFDPQPDWLGSFDELPELLRGADFAVIACPLTDATRGLIGRAQLELMPSSAVLINIARGPIVDEDALYEALAARRIRGAALDVWWRYPEGGGPDVRPSAQPFHELDNVVMTPHCSGWTDGLMARRFAVIIDNIERLRMGKPLRNQVHPRR